jgi:hypothetical protein
MFSYLISIRVSVRECDTVSFADLDQSSQMTIFESILTTFEMIYFLGTWSSSKIGAIINLNHHRGCPYMTSHNFEQFLTLPPLIIISLLSFHKDRDVIYGRPYKPILLAQIGETHFKMVLMP